MNWPPLQRTNWSPPPEKKKRGRGMVGNGRREGRFRKKRWITNKWDPSE
jgi:hypothetical protein